MRLSWFAIAAVSLGGCSLISVEASAPSVRVMTYNIHAGKDAQQVNNLDRVAAVIDSAGADIVLLQEVDRRTQRAGGADHFEELVRRTGWRGVFGKALDYEGGEYGIAVLSRWPLDSVAVVPLAVDHQPPERASGNYEPRVVLHVIARTPAGSLHILNTHLDATGGGAYRRQQLVAMLAHLEANLPTGATAIIAGDLNARPPTTEIAAMSFVFRDAFKECGSGIGETFPAHAPDRRIDYIFYRGARCRAARVVEGQASDHRPVMAILEIVGDK